MNEDRVRIGGLFRCCIQSILDGQPGTEGEIRGCTVGRGCDSRVVYRAGAWEWLRAGVSAPHQVVPGVSVEFCVIRRRWQVAAKKRGRRPGYAWTLHRADCVYVERSNEAVPAPAQPYPNTVNCAVCKPTGDGHLTRYAELPSGRWAATCTDCDAVAESTTKENARMMMVRRHRNATTASAEGCA